ncbi:MAG: PQQ-binding-like beta-propeller repeat protein [Haloglomus sp.]
MAGWSDGPGLSRRGVLGAGTGALAALAGCSGVPVLGGNCRLADASGAWPQPGRDAGHTAYVSDDAGPAGPNVAWETTVADASAPRTTGIAVADDVLYAVGVEEAPRGDQEMGLDGFYRVFDAADGARRDDRVGMDAAVVGGPVVARERDLTLFVGRDSEGTHIMEEGHGAESGVLGRNVGGRTVAAPVLAPDGDRVYAAAPGGAVGFALSGEYLFSRGLPGRPRTPPAVDGNAVYIATRGRGLFALDPTTGETKWRDGRFAAGPPVVRDGTVYVRDGSRLRAFETDGNERWTATVDGDLTGPPAVTDGVLVHTDRTTAYARRPDGSQVWQAPVENRPCRQPLATGGRLYVPGAAGVTALDPASGERLWRYAGGVVAPPALAGGALFCPGARGSLVALGACRG